mmetsp:Transcript_25208/g.40072  ORF Transcript_25208/g.40072 Transcript_25208/m.40072 type:complete len:220 (-) Transcript_25208:899-1558(-)
MQRSSDEASRANGSRGSSVRIVLHKHLPKLLLLLVLFSVHGIPRHSDPQIDELQSGGIRRRDKQQIVMFPQVRIERVLQVRVREGIPRILVAIEDLHLLEIRVHFDARVAISTAHINAADIGIIVDAAADAAVLHARQILPFLPLKVVHFARIAVDIASLQVAANHHQPLSIRQRSRVDDLRRRIASRFLHVGQLLPAPFWLKMRTQHIAALSTVSGTQ